MCRTAYKRPTNSKNDKKISKSRNSRRYAKEHSKNGKVDTFDFLGFTHYCGLSKMGKFRVKRKTAKKKFNAQGWQNNYQKY